MLPSQSCLVPHRCSALRRCWFFWDLSKEGMGTREWLAYVKDGNDRTVTAILHPCWCWETWLWQQGTSPFLLISACLMLTVVSGAPRLLRALHSHCLRRNELLQTVHTGCIVRGSHGLCSGRAEVMLGFYSRCCVLCLLENPAALWQCLLHWPATGR